VPPQNGRSRPMEMGGTADAVHIPLAYHSYLLGDARYRRVYQHADARENRGTGGPVPYSAGTSNEESASVGVRCGGLLRSELQAWRLQLPAAAPLLSQVKNL
jgi:hypothetical protein